MMSTQHSSGTSVEFVDRIVLEDINDKKNAVESESTCVVSKILADLLTSLYVFSSMQHTLNVDTSTETKNIENNVDRNNIEIDKAGDDCNEVSRVHDNLQTDGTDVSQNDQGISVIECNEKQKIFQALNLSPFQRNGKPVDSDNIKERQTEDKRKECVHFNSPLTTVYEFSELSPSVSDSSTQILSDSEETFLSQTYSEKTEHEDVQNVDDANILTELNEGVQDNHIVYRTEDAVLTAGGDCFNAMLNNNFTQPDVVVENTMGKGDQGYDSFSISISSSNVNSCSVEKETLNQDFHEEECQVKDELKQSIQDNIKAFTLSQTKLKVVDIVIDNDSVLKKLLGLDIETHEEITKDEYLVEDNNGIVKLDKEIQNSLESELEESKGPTQISLSQQNDGDDSKILETHLVSIDNEKQEPTETVLKESKDGEQISLSQPNDVNYSKQQETHIDLVNLDNEKQEPTETELAESTDPEQISLLQQNDSDDSNKLETHLLNSDNKIQEQSETDLAESKNQEQISLSQKNYVNDSKQLETPVLKSNGEMRESSGTESGEDKFLDKYIVDVCNVNQAAIGVIKCKEKETIVRESTCTNLQGDQICHDKFTNVFDTASEVFTKVPITYIDPLHCSPDLLINCDEADFGKDSDEPVKPHPKPCISVERSEPFIKEALNSKNIFAESSPNNFAWNATEKRLKSSPDLHGTKTAKKQKSEEIIIKSSRKRKQTISDDTYHVKMFKLSIDACNTLDSSTELIPKMLRQLATETLSDLEETVVWDSSLDNMKNKDKILADKSFQLQSSLHNEKHSLSIKGQDNEDDCSVRSPAESMNNISDMCHNQSVEKGENWYSCGVTSKECLHTFKQVSCSNKESGELGTNSANSEEHGSFLEDQKSTKNQVFEDEKTSCEKDANLNVKPIEINVEEKYDVHKATFSESVNNIKVKNSASEVQHDQDFITATELFSQNSQISGSTGFTVNETEFHETGESHGDTYCLGINDGTELKENSDVVCNVNVSELEQRNKFSPIQSANANCIVEITEDGFSKERLAGLVEVREGLSYEPKGRYIDTDSFKHPVTDQDEQIDSDQLDMFVDQAVDQIVPENKFLCRSLETECDMYKNNQGEKMKMYACDLDICDEMDSPVCKPVNKPGKLYEKCFNWKYRPSCDVDPESDAGIPELPDEDQVVRITPLKTCGKPLRLGLSRRQHVKNSLHKFGMRK